MLKLVFSLLIFLTPLLFWTLTPNFFLTPKLILLVLAVLILAFTWAYRLFSTRSLTISTSPLRFGLLAFALVVIANLALNPVGRLESLTGPAGIYLLLSLLSYFLSLYPIPYTLYSILASTTLLSLHTLLQLTLLYQWTALPLFMQSRSFSLAGSPLNSFILLALGGAVSLFLALKSSKFKAYAAAASVIHAISLVALGMLILPSGELALNLLPLRASWNIALDAMKSARSLFFGIGLTQFPNFYRAVKPLYLNSTPFWNALPSTSSSELLQIWTTMGVLGILSFLSLPVLALKSHISHDPLTTAFKLLLVLSTLALAFTPGSLPLLLVFFTSLGVVGSRSHDVKSLTYPASLIISLLVLALSGYLGYFTARVVAAEYNMRQAQLAITQNDGKAVYEHHLAAIGLLPRMTNYRLSYSQVNLSLASAISQKNDSLTDVDRQNISQLLSQSIREGKLATSLSPSSSSSWQNLGIIYKNLINVAEGTDKFAIEAYAQAVALDPGNPALRVDFGGLLYQLKEYPRAQTEFQTAIQLKPDYANAYYNLSKLLETIKDYPNAVLSLQKTISLLGPSSPDLSQANAELTALQAKLPKPTPSPSPTPDSQIPSTISEPSPLPSPLPGGPIDIP